MDESGEDFIKETIKQQALFFKSQQTKNLNFRIEMLKKLKKEIISKENEINQALWADLHKSANETFVFEFSPVINEINLHIKHLKKWSTPKKTSTPLFLWPSRSYVIYEPYGVSLIIGPFNYPFNLLFIPLIGAISSGCCAIIKPSFDTPQIATVIEEIISTIFPINYIAVVQGAKKVNEILLAQHFDFIFFTGSPGVGKIVMTAAAKHLTPIVLELGGKCPCIVDKEADPKIAAKRIIWGKTINAGQTCVAPDYLFVHQSIKDELISQMILSLKSMYGTDIKQCKNYARIVNRSMVERLKRLIEGEIIVFGGTTDLEQCYFEPTIIDRVSPDATIMQEEIFGPILPILSFTKLEETISFINSKEKPLALYYFGDRSNARQLLSQTTAGGSCINDVLQHLGNPNLPFGGVSNSGLGRYHGKETFIAFSNSRSVLSSPSSFDLPFKYPPYRYEKILRRALK